MKFGCSIGSFLNSANLICRSTDISQCFRESLRLRDNERQLYIYWTKLDGFQVLHKHFAAEISQLRLIFNVI